MHASRLAPLLPVALPLALLAACGRTFDVTLEVQDEHGQPVASPTLATREGTIHGNRAGVVHLRDLEAPVLAVVGAEGFLSEPVPVGAEWAGQRVVVRLWSDADGGRFALHAGGDTMLGRRFVDPDDGEPLVVTGDGGGSARAVVDDLALAFSMADLSTVNLETVVGELPLEAAYPGKRYLLQSPPETTDALDLMGVDVVCLANNHSRDWLDPGIQSTLDRVDQAGFVRAGAGMAADEAAVWAEYEVGPTTVAVLAWSTLGGESVNDYLPTDADAVPEDTSTSISPWKWELRTWGYPALGVEETERRAGSVWQLYSALAPGLEEDEATALWTSVAEVYPELQDLLARNGHGGANGWSDETSPLDVALAAEEAEVVVVQLHSGMEYAPVPSQALVTAAHLAIDAGADLVVAHHPHVLQGAEWYRGVPILWSMGNLVFDQDRYLTFPSAFLRTVWEADGTLLEARLLPLFMDGYRPVPIVDAPGRMALLQAWDRSWIDGQSTRLEDGRELVVYPVERDPQAVRGQMIYEWGTGRLSPEELAVETELVTIPEEGWVVLPQRGLVRRTLVETPSPDLLVGRGLVGLGSFENADTDLDTDDILGWKVDHEDSTITWRDPARGRGSLQLVRGPDNTVPVMVRTEGQVGMPEHRVWADDLATVPMDGQASYSIRLSAFASGETDLLRVRVDLYESGDPNPTENPVNTLLRQVELAVPLERGQWRQVLVDIPADAFDPVDGVRPNAGIINLLLNPPEAHTTIVRVDELEVVEWRPAAQEPDGFGAIDMIRAASGPRLLAIERRPW